MMKSRLPVLVIASVSLGLLLLRWTLQSTVLPDLSKRNNSGVLTWSHSPPAFLSGEWEGSPRMSANGERALFLRRNAGQRQLWLFERGLGFLQLSADEELVLGAPGLSSNGDAVAFFLKSRSSESASLIVWTSNSGRSLYLQDGFGPDWSAAVSDAGTTLLLQPGPDSRFFALEALGGQYRGGALLLRIGETETLEELALPQSGADQLGVRTIRAIGVQEVNSLQFGEAGTTTRLRTAPRAVPDDIEGDRGADLIMYRPPSVLSERFGELQVSTLSGIDGPTLSTRSSFSRTISLRSAAGVPVIGDYNGDGRVDWAIYRPNFSPSLAEPYNWEIILAGDKGVPSEAPGDRLRYSWGILDHRAVPADYDGDGKTDLAVFEPETAIWHLAFSSGGFNFAKAGAHIPGFGAALQFGLDGDVPLPADFDGDGKADLAVVRNLNSKEQKPLEWFIRFGLEAVPTSSKQFILGETGDVPVPADYDGDGTVDAAVYRPRNGTWGLWLIQDSHGKRHEEQWCPEGYQPIARDFDADGRADLGCFGASHPAWTIRFSRVTESGRQLFADKGPGQLDSDWSGNGSRPAAVLLRNHQSGAN